MALEGALRDLGLAEVLQLLASGQRTGVLRVAGGAGSRVALLRFHEGTVTGGRWDDEPDALLGALLACGLCTQDDLVRAADWALAQVPTGNVVDGLVETGSVGARARDAVARRLVDDLCFELTTIAEGTWAFTDEEATCAREPRTALHIPGEALVLDAARRRDEWPQVAGAIGSLAAVPVLAEPGDTSPLTEPAEGWQLLAAVDGVRTVRQVAGAAGLRVFEAARWVARWVQLGVLQMAMPAAQAAEEASASALEALLAQSAQALAEGHLDAAVATARTATLRAPRAPAAHLAAARALRALARDDEADAAVRRAAQLAPDLPEVQCELGFLAAREGRHAEADAAWARYLAAAPTAPDVGRVRAARDAVAHLQELLSTHAGA